MKIKIPYKYPAFIGILIILNIIFLPEFRSRHFSFKEGEIATEDVIAPYDFLIPKTEQELIEEKNQISQRLPPIYDYDAESIRDLEYHIYKLETLIDTLRSGYQKDTIAYLVQREFGMPRDVISYLLKNNYKYILKRLLKDLTFYLSKGVMISKSVPYRILIIVRGNKETLVSIDEIYSAAEVENLLSANAINEYKQLVKFFIKPNIIFNEQKTNERIEEVFAHVKKTKGEVLKGELIIEKHKKIDLSALEKISALEKTYVFHGTGQILKTIFFRILFFISLLFSVIYFDRQAKLNIIEKKNLFFSTTLFLVFSLIGRITYETNAIYLLPVSFFIFLFSLYYNPFTGFFSTIVFSSTLGVVYNSLSIFLFLLVSGIISCFSAHTLKSRFLMLRPMIYVCVANLVTIIFIDVYLSGSRINVINISAGVLNGIISVVALTILLPLFERLFDFTTDFTLLELGNLNLPIFKEMSMRAPGTYHHSVVVGNLAEAGASAIGADPVFARVGAYYHDIGKLKKPEYFIENQIGQKNPHDNLKPQMSALVIISHVKDGYEMGKDMKLPKNILSIIAEHHGTSRIESFYRKALHSTEKVSEDVFNYPGPKPKTREAAVVMLADSVEATARAEKNITVSKLQKILKENFDKKFNEGQLDDCPINRVDLEQIKTAFLPILMGIFHPRIDYEENSNTKDKHL